MAKKIEWTYSAVQDRFRIYQFWLEHNKSDQSQKLESLFNEAAKLLAEYPELGTETDFQGIRIKVIKNHKLFYKNLPEAIQIIRVWDTRQDLEKFLLPR
jgi:plasmid stabilization system protein ParE